MKKNYVVSTQSERFYIDEKSDAETIFENEVALAEKEKRSTLISLYEIPAFPKKCTTTESKRDFYLQCMENDKATFLVSSRT